MANQQIPADGRESLSVGLISVITSKQLGLCGTMLGKEHPSTLTSINNMAAVLKDQGKYGQAGGCIGKHSA